jgi:chemotaxis-related protein WspB
MLFLLFQLGKDRYALQASHVVEVLPLVELKSVPEGPKGFAGFFNYRGRPVPAVDLSQLTLGRPSAERLSTRLIVINCNDGRGNGQLLGFIAEHATEMIDKNPTQFVESGLSLGSAPYLGPILIDSTGPIQLVREQHFLSENVRSALFEETLRLSNATD